MNSFSKYRGRGALGQLGNQKQHRFDPPPQEFMSQQPAAQMQYNRPKARQAAPQPMGLAGINENKEARRQQWLKKRRNKRRGLRQLNMGGQSWN